MKRTFNVIHNRLVMVIFASLLSVCTCNIAKAQIIANTDKLITIQLPATENPKIIKYNDNLNDDIWLLPSIGHQLPLPNLATAFLEKPQKPQRFYIVEELELSLIHISEPTRQAEISYAVFCLKKKK